MPIFEYHCDKCGHEFECLIVGSHQPECDSCSSKKVTRRMSACSYKSKGSGGETTGSSAGSSSCSGCTAGSCAGCGTA
ncbi:MAG: zinc ribbon domain-containing protein [Desulfobacterales bacterium]|nr:zinc ribbon domain-containing protein [Desulfobacterales bacterium]